MFSVCVVGQLDFVFVYCLLVTERPSNMHVALICSDNFTCCYTQTEVADQIYYLTQ